MPPASVAPDALRGWAGVWPGSDGPATVGRREVDNRGGQIGRKPIILGGMLPASLTYYPLYTALGRYAEPGNVSYPMSVLIVVILVNYVGMTYGPIGAFLAEYFSGRIRYTSVSVSYHIGNGRGGGLVPIITTSAYLSTGRVGWALVYPIALPAISFLLAL